MKILIIVVTLALLTIGLHADVTNPDKPLKGEWDFNLKKVWEINKAGDEIFARPIQIMVSNEGNIYIFESKKPINYLLDCTGKLIKSFGNKGEGPGEIRNQGQFYLIGDKLIVGDSGRFHYFKKSGQYIKYITKSNLLRGAHFFISENELISAPHYKVDMADGIGKISISNLADKKETVLAQFTMPETVFVQINEMKISILVMEVTPVMNMGFDDGSFSGKKRLYYGMNDKYIIHAVDLKGKKLCSFSIDRSPQNISDEEKKKLWGKGPESKLNEMDKQIINKTGNKVTCFSRIDVIKGLVYVFESILGENPPVWKLDIFSLEGKYLYHAKIQPGNDVSLYFPLGNLVIKEDHLYAVLEQEDSGEIFLTKYKIQLPTIE